MQNSETHTPIYTQTIGDMNAPLQASTTLHELGNESKTNALTHTYAHSNIYKDVLDEELIWVEPVEF